MSSLLIVTSLTHAHNRHSLNSYFFFDTGSHVAEADLKLSMKLRITLNFRSSASASASLVLGLQPYSTMPSSCRAGNFIQGLAHAR